MTALKAQELEALTNVLEAGCVLTQSSETISYASDWSRIGSESAPAAVVFPHTTEEVKDVVLWANSYSRALVASGGRTGMSGGASAAPSQVVVSLEKMNRILSFDPVDQIVTCEAGCITEQIQHVAEGQGLLFPVNFGAAGSSHMGGNVATNAGGLNVIQYGLTRAWVAGLVVVTGGGEILDLNACLVKDTAGYDLKHLFVGSEGTLGIITKVSLRLTARPKSLRVMLFALPEPSAALAALLRLRGRLKLTAFEIFPETAVQAVVNVSGQAHPFADNPASFYLLVEFETSAMTKDDEALSCFQALSDEGLVIDGILAESSHDARRLWSFRERIPECLSQFQPYRTDLSVRPSQMTAFVADVEDYLRLRRREMTVLWYGHIGDGNVHLNIIKPDNMSTDRFEVTCATLSTGIARIVAHYRGSVSAEHGIGLLKKPLLKFSRSEHEINYMRMIKQVFDPLGVLNPGKIFDGRE